MRSYKHNISHAYFVGAKVLDYFLDLRTKNGRSDKSYMEQEHAKGEVS